MSLFEKVATPNSRLLHVVRSVRKLGEWQLALDCVEAEIRRNPLVEEANSSIYLYFFAHWGSLGDGEEYRIGREIVGPARNTSLYDRDRGHCYRAVLGRFPPDWEALKAKEKQLRSAFRDVSGGFPAKTWRISFDAVEPDQIFLEFFAIK